MSWLNLLWILTIIALCSWALANLLITAFIPLLKSASAVTERRALWRLAILPWLLPVLATVSLLLLAKAKRWDWIDDHCLEHQASHPHFCLEHLPDMTLQLAHSLGGLLALLMLFSLFSWRLMQLYPLFKQSRTLCKLIHGQYVKNTLHQSQPLAFTLGIHKPLIFISRGLRGLLSRRQLRMVVKHEIAHIRNRDVLKNTLFEMLLGIHLFPQRLRARWYTASEIRADACVSRHFDSLEVADVLIKLHRAGVNSPFPVSVTGAGLPERIRQLLDSDTEQNQAKPALWLFYLLATAFPIALLANHHRLETLWGWLL